jgi:CDP-glucose 4,6-dehydratase
MPQFHDRYRDRAVLLTGHTGFKGSWMAHWLARLGARVTGYALDPATQPNHWDMLRLPIEDRRGDIRDVAALRETVIRCAPEIVFHLAAQPLVRRSYRDPLETWSTNVMGTANLLDACRATPSVKAIVIITTDKVYRNEEWPWGYREVDPLGGHDPYSASKACAELVTDSYRKALFHGAGSPLIATARAGNVIGGGDWSEDRLIPDLVRAVSRGERLQIRSPNATRPWQHVLETAAGYLQLGAGLLEGEARLASAWNFGPEASDNRSVGDVLTRLAGHWPELSWDCATTPPVEHEANLLYLDSSKARSHLPWKPVWPLDRAIAETAAWYRACLTGAPLATDRQLDAYVAEARALNCAWAVE